MSNYNKPSKKYVRYLTMPTSRVKVKRLLSLDIFPQTKNGPLSIFDVHGVAKVADLLLIVQCLTAGGHNFLCSFINRLNRNDQYWRLNKVIARRDTARAIHWINWLSVCIKHHVVKRQVHSLPAQCFLVECTRTL